MKSSTVYSLAITLGLSLSPLSYAASSSPTSTSSAAVTNNAFNPEMSLILSGGYTHASQDPEDYRIAGFDLPSDAEAGLGSRGFSLSESELDLSANIDTYLHGVANIAMGPEDSISVEQAYIQTTSLGYGLQLKAGRFFSSLGYVNSQHAHAWDFADAPLAYQAMLGTQFADDGLQLMLLAPTDQFLQVGVELGRGRTFPGTDTSRNGTGSAAITIHTGGDVGDSHSWRAGVSALRTKADGQELLSAYANTEDLLNTFTGSTKLWVIDSVWKWAPNGNFKSTNFKLQGEYIRSKTEGDLVYDFGDSTHTNTPYAHQITQSGWYIQGIYQFKPQWRIGMRTERLSTNVPEYAINETEISLPTDQAHKNSVMLDFSPSEFSRVRLQVAKDYARGDMVDNQLVLQYQMSLGAHGAHSY